jgi:P27 family predicted phage terminase small subunit
MAMGTVREMEREIQRLGSVQKVYKLDKEGNSCLIGIRKNPAVSIQSDAMTRARLLAAELGCTPVSRSRPTVEDNEGDDDLFGWGN